MKNISRIPKKEIEIRKDLALRADPLQTLQGFCDQRKVEVLYYQKDNPWVDEWIRDEIDKHKMKYKDSFDDNSAWEDFRNVVYSYLYSTVLPNFIKAGKYMKEGRLRGYLRDTINTQFKNFSKKEGRALPKEDRDDYDENEIVGRGKKSFREEIGIENLSLERQDIRNIPDFTENDHMYMSLRQDGWSDVDTGPYCGGIYNVRKMKKKIQENLSFEDLLRIKLDEDYKPTGKRSQKKRDKLFKEQQDNTTNCSCSEANCKKYDPKKCILDTRTNRYTCVR